MVEERVFYNIGAFRRGPWAYSGFAEHRRSASLTLVCILRERSYGDAKHDFFSSGPAPRVRAAGDATERRASIPYTVKPWTEPEAQEEKKEEDMSFSTED